MIKTEEHKTDLVDLHLNPPEEYKTTYISVQSKKQLSTQELMYCAVIGVMGGFISSVIPFGLLIKVWYPFVGGKQLISGHHLIWGAIVYGLTRKKRSILFTMFIKGILEFMLGDTWGIIILFANLLEGSCLLVGFKMMESFGESDTKLGWGLAGGFGNFFQAPFFWTLNQRWFLHWVLWALAFIFAFISGVLITGVMGKLAKDYLVKVGVPTRF